MEPKLPAPSPSPETGAYNPQVLPPHPEIAAPQRVESALERPAQQEMQPTGQLQSAPLLPLSASQPQPRVQNPTIPLLNPVTTTDPNPAAAADDEVIEKEWVDKAKKIVEQTKDDPHKQEQEVSKLQADYLMKRYGKEVKLTSD